MIVPSIVATAPKTVYGPASPRGRRSRLVFSLPGDQLCSLAKLRASFKAGYTRRGRPELGVAVGQATNLRTPTDGPHRGYTQQRSERKGDNPCQDDLAHRSPAERSRVGTDPELRLKRN